MVAKGHRGRDLGRCHALGRGEELPGAQPGDLRHRTSSGKGDLLCGLDLGRDGEPPEEVRGRVARDLIVQAPGCLCGEGHSQTELSGLGGEL